jgi:hypothetical protein
VSALRWAALAAISALWSVALATIVALIVIRRHTEATTTVAPIAMTIAPTKSPRWPKYKATAIRFGKVFAFVALGFIASAAVSKEGLQAAIDPANAIVLAVASVTGALLKFFTWKDIDAEAPATVTLALTPTPTPTEGETP